jgi:subtilisin family serine protease
MKVLITSAMALIVLSYTFAVVPPDDFLVQRDDSIVQSSLQKILERVDADGRVRVWVFFTDKGFTTLSEYNAKLQETENNLTRRAKNRRLKARGKYNLVDFKDVPVYQSYIDQVLSTGVKKRRILRWFNAVTIEATPQQLHQIAQLPFVREFKHVSTARYPSDYVKTQNLDYEAPLISTALNYGPSLAQLEQINTIVAHELGFAGQDVLVCMMDTGYRQAHQAFQEAINDGRLIAQWDFINDDDNADYDPDQDVENQPNHGTLTWSTLGGASSGNLYGPAYRARFCLAKTEDITGEHHIEEDNWAAGAQWADSLGAEVISASLGYRYSFDWPDEDYTYEDMNGDSTIVTQAADLAVYNGIAVVTAMGNEGVLGSGSLIAPADGDSVIAVGAVDEDGWIAGFSALGPTYDGRTKPEVLARGLYTVCADPWDMNGYSWASGTSLSTPLCGGAAALLLSAHPNWTPVMVREAMMMTANNMENPDNTYGWGIVNVGRAMYYHPENDIVIEHEPLVYFPPYLDNNIIYAEIYGGAGVDPDEVYLFWRTDEAQPFNQEQMITSDNLHFEGIVPGLDEGYLQYYIQAADVDGIYTTYPYGAPEHFLTVQIGISEFYDSFENGLYYWKASGVNGCWSITAERANTGNISITDSPYEYYNNNAELILASNFSINLALADSAVVRFKALYALQANNDFVYFEVSTDSGQQWQQVGQPITGSNYEFEEITLSLEDFLNEGDVRFRFRMITNEYGYGEGIHIDDIRIWWDIQVDISDSDISIPREFSLAQNYPNPFNASTKISFVLSQSGDARLIIYDLLGRKVKTLVSSYMESGSHEIVWDGTGDDGNDASSGIYLYKLVSDGKIQVKRMTLLR